MKVQSISSQIKRNFSRFDILRIAKSHFDGNGADDRHPVALKDYPTHVFDEELALVVKLAAVRIWLRAYSPDPNWKQPGGRSRY